MMKDYPRLASLLSLLRSSPSRGIYLVKKEVEAA